MEKTKSYKALLILLLPVLCLIFPFNTYAQSDPDPENAILVKDFTWRSGGRGQPAILKEITLKNTGIKEYKNIEIELELYTKTDTPQGSLRSTIKDVLPAGSEKTYYNIEFGIMHSELQKATARVVRAEEIEKGTPTHPRHLLLVKDWDFSGGRYGTEGILKTITIENRSSINFKDIKIKLSNLGVSGPKVGAEGYTSIVVIHDFIPAGTTKTFKNINIGFRHPDATRYNVYVMDAEKISSKEIRYKLAEKEKLEGKTRERKTKTTVMKEASETESSLAERYRKRLEEEKQKDSMVKGETVPDEPAGSKQKTQDKQTADIDRDTEEIETEQPGKTVEKETASETISEKSEEGKMVEEVEEEVAIPKYDIIVRSFKWGSGVPGTVGVLRSLTLENVSGLNYTKIQLIVEFFSPTGVPLGSNDLTLYETLPAGETRTFRDLEIGLIQLSPDSRNMKIRVKDASVMKR